MLWWQTPQFMRMWTSLMLYAMVLDTYMAEGRWTPTGWSLPGGWAWAVRPKRKRPRPYSLPAHRTCLFTPVRWKRLLGCPFSDSVSRSSMQRNLSQILLFFLAAVFCLAAPDRVPAQESPKLLKARKEAEQKGFTFIASHDEIIAQAKKEGRLRVLFSLTPESYPHISKAFKQKYPFIDLYLEEITGTDAAQRFLMELQAGLRR